MNFVAINFETANTNRTSACALAAVEVVNGKTIRERVWYIKPPKGIYFLPTFSAIHDITPETVVNQPTFAEIWPKLTTLFTDRIVVTHNANFDIAILLALLEHYHLPIPQFLHFCLIKAAYLIWPGLAEYKLIELANKFRIEINHHDPLIKSKVCATIMIQACKACKAKDIVALSNYLGIDFARIGHDDSIASSSYPQNEIHSAVIEVAVTKPPLPIQEKVERMPLLPKEIETCAYKLLKNGISIENVVLILSAKYGGRCPSPDILRAELSLL